MTDFIGVYDEALSPAVCRTLIERFEYSDDKRPGATGRGVDRQKKESDDLDLSSDPAWLDLEREVMVAMLAQLVPYARAHPFLLVGALTPSVPHPSGGQHMELEYRSIEALSDTQVARLLMRLYRVGPINLQRYLRGRGHYRHWHSEHYPDPRGDEGALHRVLFLMIYLNDVADGGETKFYFQERQVQPATGRLLIAPAGFTHTHAGEVPRSGHKYVVTTWLMFQPAERLYGG